MNATQNNPADAGQLDYDSHPRPGCFCIGCVPVMPEGQRRPRYDHKTDTFIAWGSEARA